MAQLGAAISLILLSRCESFPPALLLMTFAIGMTGFTNAGAMVLPQDIAPEYAGSVSGFSQTVSTLSGVYILYCRKYGVNIFHQIGLKSLLKDARVGIESLNLYHFICV